MYDIFLKLNSRNRMYDIFEKTWIRQNRMYDILGILDIDQNRMYDIFLDWAKQAKPNVRDILVYIF